MSWERDPLWAKARLYFERAFDEPRDDPRFGLWCSLGLELLARAAVASVSPTLLAEPDKEHKFLLHALKRGSQTTPPRSIGTAQVFNLCKTLFDGFTKADLSLALALANRRNDELHTGGAPFDEFPPKDWITAFYRICRALTKAMGESLESLFGTDEAKVAEQILEDTQTEVRQRVENTIAAHRKVFEAKLQADRKAAAENAEKEGARLAFERHHRVKCPACGSVATVQGEPFGREIVTHEEGNIKVQQPVSPHTFACPACGLKLQGYAELDAAQLGGHYTRTTNYSPEDYYGLVDAENIDPSEYVEAYLADLAAEAEGYDNE
jgi:predicted RNA-binding Zn-ribbon protein involved in translation (DUF1610 family)